MRAPRIKADKVLLLLMSLLVVAGAMIFPSAAFGLVARGEAGMSSVVFNHLIGGIGIGVVLLIIGMQIDYHRLRPLAPYLFGLAITATALVFVPFLGLSHGGGTRWLLIGGFTFQPSEALKLTGVIAAATYFAAIRGKITTHTYGLGGLLAILALPTPLLILQPDLGTLAIVGSGICAVFFIAGARFRDIALVFVCGLLALALLATVRPYVRDRVMTFINPSHNQQQQGYQIRQSLIAIGSGGVMGRGFGQGVQKFTYLPEPMGDSIFAVAGEELGFAGGTVLILLFLALALRGFFIAAHAPDLFGALLASGISSVLVTQAFVNIGAMLAILPLTGIPLTFVSQGGSAMMISLASAGVLLNVSKYRAKSAKPR